MPATTMKAITVHCVAAPKAASDSACGEKPPVGIVVKAWATAS